jgi:uncharacterized protein YdeI (YjbR/CyaY-like superfamily)
VDATAPTYFATPAAFRRWLARHHARETELWVGFHKKGSGTPSITWPESVDEALCFGWIDGLRKSVDADRYMIRFTPRKRNSIWSVVNTRRAQALIEAGRMQSAGLAAFEARTAERSGVYAFERREAATLEAGEEAAFRRHRAAWRYFESCPAGYRRTALHWVTSAKRAETRARRLATLIEDSSAGRRLKQLRRAGE